MCFIYFIFRPLIYQCQFVALFEDANFPSLLLIPYLMQVNLCILHNAHFKCYMGNVLVYLNQSVQESIIYLKVH